MLHDSKQNRIESNGLPDRILLVDDDKNILTLLYRHTRRLGFNVDLAGNGEEALELLKNHSYALVISDIMMPVMDGMTLLRCIKQQHADTDVLIISAYGNQYSFSDLITAGASDFIGKPFEIDELRAKIQRIFRERSLLAELGRSKEKERLFFLRLVESLATSLNEKDKYTHGHARRVTNLSLQLAEHLNDTTMDLELLRLSGMLHDIGKIGVPDSILLKVGRLTEEEFAIIKKHPDQGARILRPMGFNGRMNNIVHIIRHHHERFDGKGYPDGLVGEAIPLYSRIIAVADSYDAMTSDRPYRKSMNYRDALAEIEKNAGRQFDPVLAEKFVELMEGCHDEKPCPLLSVCEVFARIKENSVSQAYEMQYCCTNFKACARYKMREKKEQLKNLMPDGSLFIGDELKEIRTGVHLWQEKQRSI
ncbi:MAG: response regulator [Proteobacteria bacterium]|nr:response regulator [Pseudomonadota bacterium]MBU1419867.1 response regulator [Pseudomonadota bacterium]MBU1456842.1 response regulator [Pseudomonadota bacterium]